jgi:hypothetical protein
MTLDGVRADATLRSVEGSFRRRGIVWIAREGPVPEGRLTDPVATLFWASWQHEDEGVLGNTDIRGAEAAIAWGRQRANVVLIRLGSSEDTYFSAGDEHRKGMPSWPPPVPADGWWIPPSDDWWPMSFDESHRIGSGRARSTTGAKRVAREARLRECSRVTPD